MRKKKREREKRRRRKKRKRGRRKRRGYRSVKFVSVVIQRGKVVEIRRSSRNLRKERKDGLGERERMRKGEEEDPKKEDMECRHEKEEKEDTDKPELCKKAEAGGGG